MSGETTVNKLPYPSDSDVPNGPAQIKALAELLDTLKWGIRNLKPSYGVVEGSETLTLSGSFQDIVGAKLEISAAVSSKLLAIASFDFEAGSGTDSLRGTLNVDSSDLPAEAPFFPGVNTARGSAVQLYSISLAVGSHTIKMRAKRAAGSAGKCFATSSHMMYVLLAA